MNADFTLDAYSLHVWAFPIESTESISARLWSSLSPDEVARAERFRSADLRLSYTTCRGVVRFLLGHYLNIEPSLVQFEYLPRGKPVIANFNHLKFNISHSAKLMLCGMMMGDQIGVDVERIRPLSDMQELARNVYCPEEVEELTRLPETQRHEAFYRCWTRKEAYLKALGEGLSTPLNGFRVNLGSTEPARFIHIGGDGAPTRLRVSNTDTWREIIGVAEDVHYEGVKEAAPSIIYWPLMMQSFVGQDLKLQRATVFVVRSRRAGTQLLMRAIQQQAGKVSPDVPLTNSGTLGDLYTKSMARTSFTLVILCASGVIALLIGSVGIYGVIAYSAIHHTRRTKSSAALHAQRRALVRASLRQGMLLTVPGIALGLVTASATMPFMSSLLYGVSANDPPTYIATASTVVLSTLLACYLLSLRTPIGVKGSADIDGGPVGSRAI